MKAVSLKKSLKGFSIIELLIAIIIIGILVAVIVPRLATRSELARQRAAKSDLEHIRNAEEHAGIDTGYYYRLYVLDDNPRGDGIGTGLPVIVFAFLLAFGAQTVGKAFHKLSHIEKWVRRITGVTFIIVGIYYSLIYIFGLPI